MEKALLELIELAKSAAPELWEIAKMQVQANIWGLRTALWITGIIIAILTAWVIYIVKKDGTKHGVYEPQLTVGFVLIIFWVAAYVYHGMMLRAIDYYAIRELLNLVR